MAKIIMKPTKRKFKHIPSGHIIYDIFKNGILCSPFLQIKWTIEKAENDKYLIEL